MSELTQEEMDIVPTEEQLITPEEMEIKPDRFTVEEDKAEKARLQTRAEEGISKGYALGATIQELSIASKKPISEVEEIITRQLDTVIESTVPTASKLDSLEEGALEMVTTALDKSPKPRSEADLKDTAETALLIKGVEEGEDDNTKFLETLEEVRNSPSINNIMAAHQEKYARQVGSQIRSHLANEVKKDPMLLGIYQQSLEMADAKEEEYRGAQGLGKILVEKYADETLDELYLRELEVKMGNYELMKEDFKNDSIFDKIINWGAVLIDPVYNTLAVKEMAATLVPKEKSTGDNIEDLGRIIKGYQEADPEIKKELFPQIYDAAKKAYDGNAVKVQGFVAMLHDPDFDTQLYIDGALDAVEGASYVAALPTLGTSLITTMPQRIAKAAKATTSIAHQLASMGNIKKALEVSRRTRTPHQRANDVNPFDMQNTVTANDKVDGLSATAQAEYEALNKEFKDVANDTLSLDPLAKPDQEFAQKQALKKLANFKTPGGWGVSDARIAGSDGRSFQVQYNLVKPGETARPFVQNIRYTIDDAGQAISENLDFKPSLAAKTVPWLLSPENILKGNNPKLVGDIQFGHQQASAANATLNRIWKDVVTKEGKDQGLIDDLIRTGDEWGEAGERTTKRFTRQELKDGNIETGAGKLKYTDEQIDKYFLRRQFYDNMHGLSNVLARENLVFQNFKEGFWVNPKTGIDEVFMVKPYKDARGFPTESNQSILAPGLLGPEISVVNRGSIDVAGALEQGYTAVRFAKPVKVGEELITHGLIPPIAKGSKGGIRELPEKVLHYNEGYAPDVRTPGLTYIKDAADGNRTVARAANEKEARDFAERMNQRQIDENVPANERVAYTVIADRDYQAMDNITEAAETFGGLVYGSRSSTKIQDIGSLAARDTRVPIVQATQKTLETISSHMPLNEYKMATIARFKEVVKEALRRSPGISEKEHPSLFRAIDDPKDWREVSFNNISDVTLRKQLEAERDYLLKQFSISTNSENAWRSFMMDRANMLNDGKAQRVMISMAHDNPLSMLKRSVFDATFGWFNPGTMLVQAANAAQAVAMHPIHGVPAVIEMSIQKLFLNTPTLDRDLLAKVAKGVIDDPARLEDLAISLQQFKKSGLSQDAVTHNADMTAVKAGLSPGFKAMFDTAKKKGRIFFQQGVEMGLLTSWNIARKRWMKENPGRVMDDSAIREISDETLRLNTNFQTTNAAAWQTNPVTALPTMFIAPFSKLVGNVVGGLATDGKTFGQWSRKESIGALAGLTVMFGVEGVPVAQTVAEAFKESVSGSQLDFALDNPNWNKAIDEGMTGVIANFLGMENDLGSRMNLLAGLDDNAVVDFVISAGNLITGRSRELEITSPATTRIKRGYNVLESAYDSVRYIVMVPTLEAVGDSAFHFMDAFAAQASSWSNLRKVVFLESLGGLPDSRGNIVLSAENMEGMSLQTKFMKAMGYQTNVEKAYYQQYLQDIDMKAIEKETYKDLKNNWLKYKLDGNEEKFMAINAMLLNQFRKVPDQQERILLNFIKDLASNKSSKDKQVLKIIIDRFRTGGVVSDASHQATLINNAIEQKENK